MVPAPPQTPVPRGRHAPPLEVRVEVQRGRLFTAAAAVFARVGYAEASAEAISREAGMSKATFYEHFANKEECLLALFDQARGWVLAELRRAVGAPESAGSHEERVARCARAFLDILAVHPDQAQALLVEVVGAGPRAVARRDEVVDLFTRLLLRDNARVAARCGPPRFASHEDGFACVGAVFELASRQLRTGQPADIRALAPTVERVVLGVLHGPARA